MCQVSSSLFYWIHRGVKRTVGWANYVYFSQFLYGLFSLGGHHRASIVWWWLSGQQKGVCMPPYIGFTADRYICNLAATKMDSSTHHSQGRVLSITQTQGVKGVKFGHEGKYRSRALPWTSDVPFSVACSKATRYQACRVGEWCDCWIGQTNLWDDTSPPPLPIFVQCASQEWFLQVND